MRTAFEDFNRKIESIEFFFSSFSLDHQKQPFLAKKKVKYTQEQKLHEKIFFDFFFSDFQSQYLIHLLVSLNWPFSLVLCFYELTIVFAAFSNVNKNVHFFSSLAPVDMGNIRS